MCNMFQDHNLVADFTESREIYATTCREYWPRQTAKAQSQGSLQIPSLFSFQL